MEGSRLEGPQGGGTWGQHRMYHLRGGRAGTEDAGRFGDTVPRRPHANSAPRHFQVSGDEVTDDRFQEEAPSQAARLSFGFLFTAPSGVRAVTSRREG